MNHLWGIIAYLLFLLAGLGARPGSVGALQVRAGRTRLSLIRLVLALMVTVLGILVGSVIDARARDQHPRYA
jgi:hypothetical protein